MVTLVARDAELESALRAVRTGRGVVILGEAGVGKTALASAVAAAVRPTMWSVATAASRQVPFGALGSLLPSDLATVHPALVPRLVAQRLRELSGGGQGLLAIDDAQLLDDHSAAAVLALVGSGSARLLATVRSGPATASGAVSDAVTALWKDGLVNRLDLEPLTREGTRALLTDRLGGEVASGAVELLWTHSQGNALYLSELVRFGTDTGRLRLDAGVWWWHGDTGVPPRLGELLQRRLDVLSDAGREVLDVLAMGDGLPYETLAAATSAEAIMDVDGHGVVTSDERDGVLRLRFAHPLLHAVAERRLTPARRRALAQRLRRVPAERVRHVGLVRRAAWEDAAGDDPNVDLLLAASDATMLSNPAGAVRFAARALHHAPSVAAALALSAARSEAGDPQLARAAWEVADRLATTDRDLLAVGLEDMSLSLWVERDPGAAAARFERMRAELPAVYADDLDSTAALCTLFSARPADALRLADEVLRREPAPSPRIRALTARLGALIFTDRTAEALDTVDRLMAALAVTPVAATRSGLAHAFVAQALLHHGRADALPGMAGTSGRWPAGPPRPPGLRAAEHGDGAEPAWPLVVGLRRHLEGDWPRAVAALREAFVQQCSGEGLFRSDAVGPLIVALAESGQGGEAAELLAATPPDAVACTPGLLSWARAAVAAADGPTGPAGEHALRAAAEAGAQDALGMAVWYLADAARFGGRATARAAADLLPTGLTTPTMLARAYGITARASGRPSELADAAERHLAVGLYGHAAELAELAGTAGTDRRVSAVRREVRARLGHVPGGHPGPALTRRELEIARMAAGGMSDRDIAGSLVVSVRTVETHLRSAYRKLDIASRHALADALQPPGR